MAKNGNNAERASTPTYEEVLAAYRKYREWEDSQDFYWIMPDRRLIPIPKGSDVEKELKERLATTGQLDLNA